MRTLIFVLGSLLASVVLFAQDAKPKLTLDEFFNSVSFSGVRMSPDGNSVVFDAEKADWDQQIFRSELWLYRISGNSGSLIQLTQSGHDSTPQWSPDGQWIAFLSERKVDGGKDAESDEKAKEVSQLYLISPNGGEAFAITTGDEEVHAFAWAPDSKAIYFSTRQPWTKDQNEAHKKDWKDVVRFRGDERGLREAVVGEQGGGEREAEVVEEGFRGGRLPHIGDGREANEGGVAVLVPNTDAEGCALCIVDDGIGCSLLGIRVWQRRSDKCRRIHDHQICKLSYTGKVALQPYGVTPGRQR